MANEHLASAVRLGERVESSAAIQWICRSLAARMNPEALEVMRAPDAAIKFRKSISSSVFEAIGSGPIIAFAEGAAPQSAFLRLVTDGAFQHAPLRTPLVRGTADATAALAGEGEMIPVTDISFDGEALTPQKAAALVVATDQAWADISSAGQGYINSLLRRGVGRVADARMFEALEATPQIEFTADPDDKQAIVAAMKAMVKALHNEAGERFRWVLSPNAASDLVDIDLGNRFAIGPDGGQAFDIPAGLTDGLPAGDLVLIRTSDVAARLIDFEIDSSGAATLDVDGDPVSMWQNNATAIRVILDMAVQPLAENVMARLTLTEGS